MSRDSAIKRKKTVLFAESWMDLQSIIQHEISQKEKNKYRVLTHICGIQKNGTDKPICKAEIETQTYGGKNVWIPRRTTGRWDKLGDWDRHIYTTDIDV